MANPLIRKLEQRDHLDEDERLFLIELVGDERSFSAGQDLVAESSRPSYSTLLLDGFAARYKLLRSGKRQITAIHIAGDFVDLHSFLLKAMDHGVIALSTCRVAVVPHRTLLEITETKAHLARLFWLNTLIDGAIHREWLVAMGRRDARGQAAFLLCELYLRLHAVGLVEGTSFRLPLTQAEAGDALGLSTVHVNRVLQSLRRRRLIEWRGGLINVLNWDGLSELAEFDPAYLHLTREAR